MDGPSPRKRARMEDGPDSFCGWAAQPFDLGLLWKNTKGSAYQRWVSDFVSTYRHRTVELKSPPGATLTIGNPPEDTVYSEDEVNGWGKFYLPKIVSMQVIGVVEGTSCPRDQLVLMTCEDRKLYAYDGEKLHLVVSSLRQLDYKGIEYPAPKRYYEGEAFKHKTEEDWAKVRQRLDQKHHELVMSKKSEVIENLKLLQQNIALLGICKSLDCARKPKNPDTERASSIQMGPKPGPNPEPPSSPTSPRRRFVQGSDKQFAEHPLPQLLQVREELLKRKQLKSAAETTKTGHLREALGTPARTTTRLGYPRPYHPPRLRATVGKQPFSGPKT